MSEDYQQRIQEKLMLAQQLLKEASEIAEAGGIERIVANTIKTAVKT